MQQDGLSRRDFGLAAGAAVAAAGLVSGSGVHAEDGPILPKFEFLYHMEADLEPPQVVGKAGKGARMIFIAKGGTIRGPKLNGTLLPGGGDWFTMRDDGVGELNVRGSFKTDDGALIYSHYLGLTHNKTDDGSRYFVTTPYYETGSEKYAWLNKIVTIGIGHSPGPNKVAYDVFKVG